MNFKLEILLHIKRAFVSVGCWVAEYNKPVILGVNENRRSNKITNKQPPGTTLNKCCKSKNEEDFTKSVTIEK